MAARTRPEPEYLTELRLRAEKRLNPAGHAELGKMSTVQIAHLLHELETHQIELEMQNEELRAAQEELIAARDRYTELYDFAPVGYLTLGEKGLIVEANLRAAEMLGVPLTVLIHRRLSEFILPDDQDTFYFLRNRMKTVLRERECELRLRRPNETAFWIRLQCIPEKTVERRAHGRSWTGRLRVVLIDVDRRTRAELQLQDYRDRLLALIRDQSEGSESEKCSDSAPPSLRAPVRGINRACRTLLHEHAGTLGEPGIARLRQVFVHTAALEERIEKLRDLARLAEEAISEEPPRGAAFAANR